MFWIRKAVGSMFAVGAIVANATAYLVELDAIAPAWLIRPWSLSESRART
jgi:hypothetical protein